MTSRPARLGVGFAAGIVILVLAGFAVVLVNQQSGDRNDIKDSFRDRATVSAALTQSLFQASAASGQADNVRRYGTREVSAATMARAAQQGQSSFVTLIGSDGTVISSSPGTPRQILNRLEARPTDVKAVAEGKDFALSNLLRYRGGLQTFELATPVETDFGRRVLVTGVSPQLLALFLSGYLKKVPNVGDGAAYLLDGNGRTIAATMPSGPPGTPPNTPGLVDALAQGDQGSFGDGNYFVTAAVESTPWEVVSTAPQDKLFASVTGAHKWVPWFIFVLLAVASAFALALLRRIARKSSELADTNDRLEQANVAIARRADELGRSNAELEQFASIASHDLKEPLRKVQTLTELLMRKEADRLSPEAVDYLERTSAAGGRMQELIDDLLKFSRVATQGRPFESVDLQRVAEQAASDLDGVVGQDHGVVEVADLPTVRADPLQMRQLLQNLISNGLKFHRENVPPEVRVTGHADDRVAEIQVSDNGIGFEPRFSNRIFRVFERLHGRGAYPGTGIGLALCRKIVDRHGGTITAESTPGEGSVFTVKLPIAQAAPSDGMRANGKPDRAEAPPVHV